MMPDITPGDHIEIQVNGKRYSALIIAAIGNERLAEYRTPEGINGLRLINIKTNAEKAASYLTISQQWLRAIVETGIGWMGYRGPGMASYHPAADVLLKAKRGRND